MSKAMPNVISTAIIFIAGFFILQILAFLPAFSIEAWSIDDFQLLQFPALAYGWDWQAFVNIWIPGSHVDFYPLRDISYWLDVNVLGAPVDGSSGSIYRFHNLVIFWGIGYMLFSLLRLLKFTLEEAFVAVLIWLLLPLHCESILWISARKDLLAMAFALGSTWFCLRGGVWLSVVFFLLSLLSKASFSLLPFFWLAVVFFRPAPLLRRQKIALFAATILSIGFSLFQTWFYSNVNDMRAQLDFSYRLQSSLAALGKEGLGLLWPGIHIVDLENWGEWLSLNRQYVIFGIIFYLLFIGWMIWRIRKKDNLLVTLGVAVVIFYLPSSGLLFPHRNLYSMRYLEPFLLPIWLIISLQARSFLNFRNPYLLTFLGLLALTLFFQAKNWDSSMAVTRKAYQSQPQNPALQRFYLSDLKNANRWGQLAAHEIADLGVVEEELNKRCGLEKLQKVQANSSLCLYYWLRSSRDPELQTSELQSKLFENFVSPLFAGTPRYDLLQLLYRQDLAKLSQQVPLADESALLEREPLYLVTPGARLAFWQHLCRRGQPQQARTYYQRLLAKKLIVADRASEEISNPLTVDLELKACRP